MLSGRPQCFAARRDQLGTVSDGNLAAGDHDLSKLSSASSSLVLEVALKGETVLHKGLRTCPSSRPSVGDRPFRATIRAVSARIVRRIRGSFRPSIFREDATRRIIEMVWSNLGSNAKLALTGRWTWAVKDSAA